MSLVRLSVLGDRVFAPEPEKGTLDVADSNALAADLGFVGRLGRFRPTGMEKDNSEFAAHLKRVVDAQTRKLQPGQPVLVMVHGFWYDPADPTTIDNPHHRNYHFSTEDRNKQHWRHLTGWPHGLGFKPDDEGERGLAVAFGWDSKPSLLKEEPAQALAKILAALAKIPLKDRLKLADEIVSVTATGAKVVQAFEKLAVSPDAKTRATQEEMLETFFAELESPLARLAPYLPDFYREAYLRAGDAARVLAHTIAAVAESVRDRPIDLFCHSLGSRVVLGALRQLATAKAGDPKGVDRVGRVIIVGGAEYDRRAREMLGEVQNAMLGSPSFYNFLGRRDRVLTHIAGKYHPIEPDLTAPIGCFGLQAGMDDPHWIDLQLDTEKNGSHPLNKWLKEKRGQGEVAGPVPKGEQEGGLPAEVAAAHRAGVLNHWYYFTHLGNMALFAAIIRDRSGVWTIDRMRRDGIPRPGKIELD